VQHGPTIGETTLSLGERVSDDGAVFSRRRTGEGSVVPCGRTVPWKDNTVDWRIREISKWGTL